jgi:hypothetical protein
MEENRWKKGKRSDQKERNKKELKWREGVFKSGNKITS